MKSNAISVRELSEQDLDLLLQYWFHAEKSYLQDMGVDPQKMPSPSAFKEMLQKQLKTPYKDKNAYCIIWEIDGQPVGHSNTNPTHFGEDAYMHLHIWNDKFRSKGFGTNLLRMTLPWYFENLELKVLYCQPFALNSAPNKTLEKVGFTLQKEYITTPGSINFEQPVKRWALSREGYKRTIDN